MTGDGPHQAVIMAGGLGTRLRPFTEVLPKPMLPVGDRSVLEIQIERLARHGVRDVYFAVNYKADVLKAYFGNGERYNVNLFYSIEKKPLGTCGPLSLLAGKFDMPFIVMNGDILTNLDFTTAYRFHVATGGIVTVVSKIVTFPLSYGNLTTSGDRIVDIQEKPDLSVEIATGIYIMSPDILAFIPKDRLYGMDELLRDLLSRQIPVHRYRMEEYWLDIGRMEDYNRAQTEARSIFGDRSIAGRDE